jgi:hypothetical protein
MERHITAHAAYPQVERKIFTPINSTILIHPKRWYAYYGEHGTFSAEFSDKYRFMFSGVWSPDKRID